MGVLAAPGATQSTQIRWLVQLRSEEIYPLTNGVIDANWIRWPKGAERARGPDRVTFSRSSRLTHRGTSRARVQSVDEPASSPE